MNVDYDPVNCQIGNTRIICYHKRCGLCQILLSGGDYCIIELRGNKMSGNAENGKAENSGQDKYQQKRDFTISPEPKGENSENSDIKKVGNIFVIQEHNASHLHWDLRLEMDGVLKSFALPKEPPQVDGIKRLAIHVEDHPIDYASFEGMIPEGNYGAGTVKLWDKGEFKLEDQDENRMVFELRGQKMKGKFVLVKTKYKGQNSWLFFKRKEGLLTF